MKEVKTEIEIHSSPATAWRVLTDFSSYVEWNPVIVKITGEARSGERLEISLRTSRGRVRTYRPVITKFEENHELRWKGRKDIYLLPNYRGSHSPPTSGNLFRSRSIPCWKPTSKRCQAKSSANECRFQEES